MHPGEVPKPTEIQWIPVILQMKEGPVVKVCGPLQAFEILNRQTITKSGPLQQHARECCLLALKRKMSADEARLAFLAATVGQTQRIF
ncbi:DUF982 domain-containing protein [Pararhizobium sp. BT-229]|uniref:DUF982 domain-containing protein n=1 Tax=Pararhizobium sp. BT-229 TaxID=2986923 RepID=UPI0021F739F1|nr:DUF982 domain-containing protein [Pararhizobium sp. BT-229]MCV9967456.1 DUF982 domain-containing protein [Pararhizobium sp. BT-229]